MAIPEHTTKGFPVSSVTFDDLLALEFHGPDTYVGIAPRYPWGRIFGGQVIAQGLRAALNTVEEKYSPHSLHAYFIRGGTHAEPIRFEVDRIRNGRSFCTRRVVARQSNGAILNLSASFHVHEDAADVSAVEIPAAVPEKDAAPDEGWGDMTERHHVLNERGHALTWLRLKRDTPFETARDAACALAFVSDMVMTSPPRSLHPENRPTRSENHELFMGASLDHAMYFQRPSDPTGWILADVQAHSLVGSRGLSIGKLFAEDGTLVSSVVQEALVRLKHPT